MIFVLLVRTKYLIYPIKAETEKKHTFFCFSFSLYFLGMHETNIIRLLETSHIYNSRLFIYYAQLINNDIPSSFEYELNRCSIKNLSELLKIIDNPLSSFQLNTRILKEILRSNINDIEEFIQSISINLLKEIYHACLACNYQTIEQFIDTLNYLHRCLEQRQNIHNKI